MLAKLRSVWSLPVTSEVILTGGTTQEKTSAMFNWKLKPVQSALLNFFQHFMYFVSFSGVSGKVNVFNVPTKVKVFVPRKTLKSRLVTFHWIYSFFFLFTRVCHSSSANG